MMNIINIFKTYGGLGVLSVWLFFTNSRVDKLEKELSDCNNSKIDIYRELTKPKVAIIDNFKVAILPGNDKKRKYELNSKI